MDMQTVKNRFDELKTSNQALSVHPKIRGVIINLLDKACGSKENRYQFAVALGLPAHSKDWTVGEWYAVSQIVKVDKDPATGWGATEPKFQEIIGAVLAHIGRNDKQMELL
jgi:hypothetical protein